MNEDAYRGVARWYDRIFEPLVRKLRSIGLSLVGLKPGMEVLDVGCGTGSLLALCQSEGCSVHGIDGSRAMLGVARSKLGGTADLRLGDATEMPYGEGTFDVVMAMLTLHEMGQPVRESVLCEMRRVLKPAGRILVIDFHPGPLRFLSGWGVKSVIMISEMAAGGEHFRNYRDFMKRGGLPPLIESSGLSISRKAVVCGGAIGLYCLRIPGGG